MKTRLLTTVLFMAASLSGFAQDRATLPKLKEATGRVLDFMMADDYQSLLEMTYPTLFSEITEKDYLADLKKQSSGDGFHVIHKDTNREFAYGPIMPFNGGHYCVIYYNYQVSVALDKPLKKADEENTLNRFRKDYPKISYEPSDNSLVASGRKTMVAVSDNATGNFWNFILDPKASYAQNIIPADAKAELNPEAYSAGNNESHAAPDAKPNDIPGKKTQAQRTAEENEKLKLKSQKN